MFWASRSRWHTEPGTSTQRGSRSRPPPCSTSGALFVRAPALLAAAACYVALLPIFYPLGGRSGPRSPRRTELSGIPSPARSSSGNVVPHALSVFVSPFYFDENGFRSLTAQPLLDVMFLAVLAPVGFVLMLSTVSGARRTLALGYGIACLAATTFYLAYYFTGSVGVHNGALHYFKPWWPLWTIAALFAVYRVGRARLMGDERHRAHER